MSVLPDDDVCLLCDDSKNFQLYRCPDLPVSILYSCRYRGNGNCEPVYSTDLLYFAVRLQHNRKLAGGWGGIEPKQRTQNLILSREQPAWKLKKDWPCCTCVTINTGGRRHPRLCFVFPPPPPYFK